MLYLSLSLVAAGLYAGGSLGLKKAMRRGAGFRRVAAVSNIAMAVWSVPLLFFFPGTSSEEGWMGALLAGFFLFWGRFFMVRALHLGDLSLVAPMLATKTILVAIFSWLSGTGVVTERLLFAALLASGGVALLHWSPSGTGTYFEKVKPLMLAALASVLFAATDVVVQGTARLLGVGWFQPAMFGTVALLVPLLGRLEKTPPEANRPMYLGSIVVAFQTSMMILLIGLSGQATLINIVYSSRSLFSVVADWWAGGGISKGHFKKRFVGALLLTAAVILAVTK